MDVFQIVLACLFAVGLLLIYGNELLRCLRGLAAKLPRPWRRSPSIAISLIGDIRAVTQLRDRLAAEGCLAGAEACTALLRVIVEHQAPAKGAV